MLKGIGIAGAAIAVSPAVLAACGDDSGSSAATTGGRRRRGHDRRRGRRDHRRGQERPRCRRDLGQAARDRRRDGGRRHGVQDGQRARADRQRVVLRQDHDPRHRPGRQAHRGRRRPEDQRQLLRPQVGRRRGRQAGHHRARRREGAGQARVRTSTTSARCSTAPRSTRCSRSTAAAAPASSARASRTSGAPGRSRPTTRCRACSSGPRRRFPDAKTVGLTAGTSASRTTATIKDDVLKKIAAAGYEFNGLYELVPGGHDQDFAPVLPKIKANEPDILLVGMLRPGPGFVRQPGGTAGLKAARLRLRVHP